VLTNTEVAHRLGFEPGPEQFGLLLQFHVAETEERAEQNAHQFMWMPREFTSLQHPVWGSPSETSRSRFRQGAGP
jgi:hypothetical protein